MIIWWNLSSFIFYNYDLEIKMYFVRTKFPSMIQSLNIYFDIKNVTLSHQEGCTGCHKSVKYYLNGPLKQLAIFSMHTGTCLWLFMNGDILLIESKFNSYGNK